MSVIRQPSGKLNPASKKLVVIAREPRAVAAFTPLASVVLRLVVLGQLPVRDRIFAKLRSQQHGLQASQVGSVDKYVNLAEAA